MVWWATYVLKERADVGGNEQHVSVHFHVKDAPVSLSLSLFANRQLEGNSAASPDDARLGPARSGDFPGKLRKGLLWETVARLATISAQSTTTCSVRREQRRSWPNLVVDGGSLQVFVVRRSDSHVHRVESRRWVGGKLGFTPSPG